MTFLYASYEITVINNVETQSYNWKSLDDLAEEIVSQWMSSKGHRENILRKDFHHGGIGIAVNDKQELYATQNFC